MYAIYLIYHIKGTWILDNKLRKANNCTLIKEQESTQYLTPIAVFTNTGHAESTINSSN